MCGILGIFNLDGKKIDKSLMIKMGQTISHRGPDDTGIYISKNIGLFHKRLSIIDTSEKGAQPMHSKDNNWVIIFNGCIYNYMELRSELSKMGHIFKSESDTEVIAEGFSAYGASFCKRLNGMFAVVAWCKSEKKLYLIRDRYGIKPIYYWFNGRTIVFSSEIKGIIKHPEYKIEVDLDALNEYFTFQNLFSFNTLFKGINLLPPANMVSVDCNSKKIIHNSWWDYDFSNTNYSMTFDEAKNTLKKLFEQAVKRQMVSDVEVGSYLSGGIDSCSISSIASNFDKNLATFTCGFDMSEVEGREVEFDERKDAELMANLLKTQQFEQIINAGDLKRSLPKLVYHLEDLKLGMSYPNYYISRLASKFVKVCLQGTGGDELFGGYPWRYYKVIDSITKEDFFDQYYDYWQRLVKDHEKKDLFRSKVFKKINLQAPRKVFERVFLFNKKLKYDSPQDHINNSLYFEIKTFLSSLFIVGDKLSMANGIEERYPFMDNDLVDFAMKVPVEFKLGNLEDEIKKIDENRGEKKKIYREFDDGKNILRIAMSDYLPERILRRKKQGFSSPDENWFRGENAIFIKETLLNNNTSSTRFIKKSFIKKTVEEHLNKEKNHRLLIWSLLNFEWWCKIFLDKIEIE